MADTEDDSRNILDLAKDKIVIYLTAGVFIFSFLCAIFISILYSLVIIGAYSAGVLIPYFLFSEGKQIPNLLVLFLGADADSGYQSRELRRSCSVCGGEECSRQLPSSLAGAVPGPHHPHIHVKVPKCVDEAVEELLNLILDEHVYSWYREFSMHDQLADEIRYVLRYACCVLFARLQEVDLTKVITDRLVPSLVSHLDQYVEGGRRVRVIGGVEAGVLEYTKKAGWLHPALHSREAEAQYIRSLIAGVKPYLLPNKYQNSNVIDSFLKELLGRFLLLQAMDFFAEPDTVNLLFLLIINPNYLEQQEEMEKRMNHVNMLLLNKNSPNNPYSMPQKVSPTREPDVATENELEEVHFLKNFASVNTHPRNSSIRSNLSAVLKDQTLLYLFHTFLKEESAINILQFCLSVEDFNRHILDPELSSSELQQLHSEALDLYHSYMAPGAPDKLPFPPDVVTQIRDMVHSEASAIVKLRTTRPLFQAYEYAYNLLEREYLPLFLNSHMYFAHLCGSRSSQITHKASNRHRRTDSSSSATFSPFKSRMARLQSILTTQFIPEEGTPTPVPHGPHGGLEGLASGSYRDLSAWRITIPRVDYVPDPNLPSKMTHFFVIDVTRIDVSGDNNSEDTHWEVLRRFHEFYILESKLTEFHGEFQYNTLPSRRSLFTSSHASDFMITRRQIFEEYLQKLLQTPALRKSQLLFLFLKSKDEFTTSFLPDASLGRLIRDVPRKLVKERGQHLEKFIGRFLRTSLADGEFKSENNSLEEAEEASESLSSEIYPLLSTVYEDNLRSLPPCPPSTSLPVNPPPPAQFVGGGIVETLMYVGVRVFGISLGAVRWLIALNAVVGATVEAAIVWFIRKKLPSSITPKRLVKLTHVLKEALVEDFPVRSSPQRRRRELELRAAVLALLPPWFTRILLDDDGYKEGCNLVVNLFQHPLLNKQLTYILCDQILEELFPEMVLATTPQEK